MRLDLVTLVVPDYDPAIAFFVDALGFELAEDTPRGTASDGSPKRWVVVRPPGGGAGLLLARADGDDQAAAVGRQAGGRVGFFLQVDDFAATYDRMSAHGVDFLEQPRHEEYGTVVVFRDVAGNTWDLLGPPSGR
ncbi:MULTISPECIES: VOC family protein [unclassified Nocardioides]|uniref:VOC family protein n=1 Tax=unclassified Nocardioides TaxID=2615069 RepID=UPI0030156D85